MVQLQSKLLCPRFLPSLHVSFLCTFGKNNLQLFEFVELVSYPRVLLNLCAFGLRSRHVDACSFRPFHLWITFIEGMYHKLFIVGPHHSWSLDWQTCLFGETSPQINTCKCFCGHSWITEWWQIWVTWCAVSQLRSNKVTVPKHSAEMLCSVPKCKKTEPCLREKTGGFFRHELESCWL